MKRTVLAVLAVLASVPAFAQEAAHAVATEASAGSGRGMIGIAAAIAIGLAAMGGALAQGKAASAALDGIARNPAAQPKVFTPMIIGMALIESLVIFALLVAFNLAGKV